MDERIGAWIEQQKGKDRAEKLAEKAKSITISREFGCEGFALAEALKGLLDNATGQEWTIFDRELIERIHEEHKLAEEIIRTIGDKSNMLDSIYSTFAPFWKDESDRFSMIAKTTLSVASEGNTIILGRGASIITKDLPNCFHFRLIASQRYKIQAYMKMNKCGEKEAADIVNSKQDSRARFYKKFLNTDFADIDSFHAVFNNEKIKLSIIAKAIFDIVQAH